MLRSGQAAVEYAAVPAPQAVLNGSRTYPVLCAVRPETGSTDPAVTERVEAGSRTVPIGMVLPRASVLGVEDTFAASKSVRFENPLFRSNRVGTVTLPVVLPCTRR